MTTSELAVWGIGSTRTMRVHWMLCELGLDYTCHPIRSRSAETQSAAFAALNPRGKIPVLRHGDLVLTESAAIVAYLAASFETPADFYRPSNAAERARLDEWCYFVMTELDAHALYLIRRHEGLKQIYGDEPGAVASARAYFLKQLEAMAERIGASGPYLLGDKFSAADIILQSCLDWARFVRIDLPDPVLAYKRAVAERASYRTAFEMNYPERALGDAS